MDRDKVPARYLRLYDSAMNGKSRRSAITAHCLMCMGWDRKAAVECTAPGCPLYPYRPKARARAGAKAKPSILGVLDEIHAAGGHAWDDVEDVDAAIREMRGD